MSSSGLSSPLTSPPSSDNEKLAPIFKKQKKMAVPTKRAATPESVASTPKRKRSPSPPHEEVLADNPDIAFIVMFRSRFTDAFSPKMSHFGPQDLENGVVDSVPSPLVESLLCALLGLVLNRKKPVERGHFGRALEDSISSNKTQWPTAWEGRNPLNGNQSFATMSPQQRLTLLKTLILWSLNSSEVITNIIKESYKQSRHDDDLNQPLSVHPWGRDGDKRRYWLVEGKDDTAFRLYRESNPALKTNHTWRSVAGTIEELQIMGTKLTEDGTQAARRLAQNVSVAIPRFEATEEKRKKREYRAAHKARFSRPEPGFSLYEGRTRGKRTKYTFSDEEDELSLSDVMPRRSTRAAASAAQPEGPTVTASGRTVRSRVGGMYGEVLHSGQTTGVDTPITNGGSEEPGSGGGRATRSGFAPHQLMNGYNSVDEMDDEEEAQSSGKEWEGGDEEEGDEEEDLEMDDDIEDDDEDELAPKESLVVRLRVPNQSITPAPVTTATQPIANGANHLPAPSDQQSIESKPTITNGSLTNGLSHSETNSMNIPVAQLPTPITILKPSHAEPPPSSSLLPLRDVSPSKPS